MNQTSAANPNLTDSIWKCLIRFFIPCWLGMLFQQLYNTVDTLIVGNFVGTNAVASVGNVSIAVMVVIGVCTSIGNGAGVVIGQHYGAGKEEQVKTDIRCSLLLALVGGFLMTIVCVFLASDMVRLLKTPEEIFADSRTYLTVFFCALIPNLVYNFGTAILRSMGDSKRPLYILIVSSIVNIVLDLVFVIWFRMGVFGVAFATDISQLVSALCIVYLLFRMYPDLLHPKEAGHPVYGQIFRLGLPTAVQSLMYSGSNVLIQIAINGFGTATIAAWSIYGKVDCICWMTISSMGMAVTSFAGQNFGAGNLDRVRRSGWIGSVLLCSTLVVLVAFCYGFAGTLFRFFTTDAVVVEYGVHMLRFLAPAYLLYFFIEILPGVMRGCGDVLIPTIASMIGICLIRVIWLTLVVPVYHTMDMVMMSYVITWGLTSLFYLFYYIKGNWMRRAVG